MRISDWSSDVCSSDLGQFACPQGIEQVASDDETVALPPCQSFALEECGALGQCALDLGSEPAAGMGCLGRQQLPVEPGRTVGTDLAFERQVRPADQRQPHLAIVPVPAAQFDDRAAWCLAGPFEVAEPVVMHPQRIGRESWRERECQYV